MIKNYDLKVEKREIQKRVIPMINKTKLVTLAGPNMWSYLSLFPGRMKKVEIWERDAAIMLEQLSAIGEESPRDITYHYGDIIHAKVTKDTFYDLDFCVSIKNVKEHLRKFKDCAFSVTLSLRKSNDYLQGFLDAVEEELVSQINYKDYTLLTTNKNVYMYTTYRGPMIHIFKFH